MYLNMNSSGISTADICVVFIYTWKVTTKVFARSELVLLLQRKRSSYKNSVPLLQT